MKPLIAGLSPGRFASSAPLPLFSGRQIDFVVVRETLAKSVYAMRPNEQARVLDFRIDQQKIPKALEGVKQETRTSPSRKPSLNTYLYMK